MRFSVAFTLAAIAVVELAAERRGVAAPRAPVKDAEACYASAEDAQRLRRDAKFIAAREKLLVCVRPICAEDVKRLCEQWLGEVEASTPSIVISAQDAAGRDVSDVRVSLDGTLFMAKLDAVARAVDPGTYMVRYEHDGSPHVEEQVLIRQGEKNRIIAVRFNAPVVVSAPERPAPPPQRAPLLGYVLVGVGVVAAGAFTVLAVSGQSSYDDWVSRGRPSADTGSLATRRAVTWSVLGVGVVSAAIGTWMLLSGGSSATRTTATRTAIDVAPSKGGGFFTVQHAF